MLSNNFSKIKVEEQKNEIARLNHLFENGKVEREANASLQIKVESLTFVRTFAHNHKK